MDLNGADEFFTVKINGVTTGAVTQLRNLKIADPYDSRGAFTFTINTSDIGGFSGQDLIIRLRPSAEMGYYAPDSPLNAVLGPFETGRVALKLSYDTIPLPAGLVLLGSGLGALALRKNRKAKAAD
ncbi:MAG: VPLPA-CTERM sorting domain-containing protein [Mangrovicoccus sp.]